MLKIENIRKVFNPGTINEKVALDGVNLTLEEGEFVTVIGGNGAGKSTTLNAVAGVWPVDSGKIYIGGEDVTKLSEHRRAQYLGRVFQDPMTGTATTMSIEERRGKSRGLRWGITKAEREKYRQMLSTLHLGLEDRLTSKVGLLSGGQRQRVAIGRAIVREPKVLLMDEPLSNLDAKLRNQMRAELIKLRQRIDTTFIYVTHDQTEAITLGDRIVIMKDGIVQQVGTPQEVFDHPANIFVAGFIGMPQMNMFDAKLVEQSGKYSVELGGVSIILSEEKQAALAKNNVKSQEITLGIRPEHIALAQPGKDAITGKVDVSEMMGSAIHLHVNACGRDTIIIVQTMDLTGGEDLSIGSEISFAFGGNAVHVFNKETGENLEF